MPPGASISLKAFNENCRLEVSFPTLCDFVPKNRIANELGHVYTWYSPWRSKNTELILFILSCLRRVCVCVSTIAFSVHTLLPIKRAYKFFLRVHA